MYYAIEIIILIESCKVFELECEHMHLNNHELQASVNLTGEKGEKVKKIKSGQEKFIRHLKMSALN